MNQEKIVCHTLIQFWWEECYTSLSQCTAIIEAILFVEVAQGNRKHRQHREDWQNHILAIAANPFQQRRSRASEHCTRYLPTHAFFRNKASSFCAVHLFVCSDRTRQTLAHLQIMSLFHHVLQMKKLPLISVLISSFAYITAKPAQVAHRFSPFRTSPSCRILATSCTNCKPLRHACICVQRMNSLVHRACSPWARPSRATFWNALILLLFPRTTSSSTFFSFRNGTSCSKALTRIASLIFVSSLQILTCYLVQ